MFPYRSLYKLPKNPNTTQHLNQLPTTSSDLPTITPITHVTIVPHINYLPPFDHLTTTEYFIGIINNIYPEPKPVKQPTLKKNTPKNNTQSTGLKFKLYKFTGMSTRNSASLDYSIQNLHEETMEFSECKKRKGSRRGEIGWNLSVKKIYAFFGRHDSFGFKFEVDSKGNVFMVEMKLGVYGSVVSLLQSYFKFPNGSRIYEAPISVSCALAHYHPHGRGRPIAPDIAICPDLSIIPKPTPPPFLKHRLFYCMAHPRAPLRYLGIPSVGITGLPHARIMCEIAVSQCFIDWNAKCELWMCKQYVRCVLGIKMYSVQTTRNANGQFDRWNFGTLDYYTGAPTACIGPDLPTYQVNIPVQDVFWNPPIINGVPSTAGYVIMVPDTVTVHNFAIDLYQIQQVVLKNQNN
ncbi:hypothetical protein Glove_386g13 [Diversispora epigaea]|uniref:Uncharacterized protein n=1 Tax=Diversispora epigaea TaxID=1348612 RepID=A0A397H396_9GLOM|nr:hypothetical protein Glove_386g13 [Diversispora epigaea]